MPSGDRPFRRVHHCFIILWLALALAPRYCDVAFLFGHSRGTCVEARHALPFPWMQRAKEDGLGGPGMPGRCRGPQSVQPPPFSKRFIDLCRRSHRLWGPERSCDFGLGANGDQRCCPPPPYTYTGIAVTREIYPNMPK